ncbi:suppressor of kinetochore protein mutant [Tyrophagus putrescentiae]|nr:suppressor of kinetochore protein mutant [Tyrophagus putrescentiae]
MENSASTVQQHNSIRVISNDQATFRVPLELAALSGYLKAFVDLCERDSLHQVENPIQLKKIDGRTLEAVFDWMARHRRELEVATLRAQISFGFWMDKLRLARWDEALLRPMDVHSLYSLRDAAHLLRVEKLKKTVERQIRRRFGTVEKVAFNDDDENNVKKVTFDLVHS